MDRKNAEEHIRNHVEYPATADSIKQACNNLSHFSPEDKKWMVDNLPNGTYTNPEAVIKAIGWDTNR